MLTTVFKSIFQPSHRPNLLISWCFLRGLGAIYFSAFVSMAGQIDGLIGANGILPVKDYLDRIAQILPDDKYWKFPTLFWLDASDGMLTLICYMGMAASALIIVNLCTRIGLIFCFLLYLSITVAGQDFTAFQWDALLLESGFLAILLTWRSGTIIFLYRLLIARFMFMSGMVKVASGDPAWHDLTALNFHYLTQPLPTPLAYYVHFWPAWFHQLCTFAVLLIELPIPFFVFLPRPFRLFAACSFIVLQTSIILTGNYNFFNLLTLLLCLFLFDDRDLAKVTPSRLTKAITESALTPGRLTTLCMMGWALAVGIVLATHIWIAQTHRTPILPLQKFLQFTMAFNVVNNYGPFAVMTKQRDEIIIEGSQDGEHWREYGFNYKPDALAKPLSWNIPHQPRLDWQLWFVPLSPGTNENWFENFLRRLQEGSPEVLQLLTYNPFPDQPPNYIRVRLYEYTFAEPEQRAVSGQIWQRKPSEKPFKASLKAG